MDLAAKSAKLQTTLRELGSVLVAYSARDGTTAMDGVGAR